MKLKIFLMTIVIIIISNTVRPLIIDANTINSIDIEVYINEKGDGLISETWNVNLLSGTEGFRTFSSLGNRRIELISLEDDRHKVYQIENNWESLRGFDQKKEKFGLLHEDESFEIVWGISEYGQRTYTIKYKIVNLVEQYTDFQAIDFNFLNLSQKMDYASIVISSFFDMSFDNTKIYGFGYDGEIIFNHSHIEMNAPNGLGTNDYMVGLIAFDQSMFNDLSIIEQSFDNALSVAKESMVYESKLYDDKMSFMTILQISAIFITLLIISYAYVSRNTKTKWYDQKYIYDFGSYKKLPQSKHLNYNRLIPCKGNLNYAYWLIVQYKLLTKKDSHKAIIHAYILKWIHEGKINIIKGDHPILPFKKRKDVIDFRRFTISDDILENELLSIMKKAAGENGVLEAKEFKKWSKVHFYELEYWFNRCINLQTTKLIEKGHVTKSMRQVKKPFKAKKTYYVFSITSEVYNDVIELLGFKQFLLDFSMIMEKESIEVELYDQYLIFASLLNIADKVKMDFAKLFPIITEQSNIDFDTSLSFAETIASVAYSNMEKGRKQHDWSAYSFSSSDSGSGGSSYSSGGSSSGGSSGGGFR